jgi:helicase
MSLPTTTPEPLVSTPPPCGSGTFRGLFVGIDRYQDPTIPWLAGAARDAQTVHALFSDTLGGESILLTDDQATTSAIEHELEMLAKESSDDDIVVVSYAGHGSPDHHLVGYDADPNQVAASCVSVDRLADLLAAIPARMLLVVLDCCFSGGFGARVLSNGIRTRASLVDPMTKAFSRFIGTHRVALTASAANEEALESGHHGHGLLTYRLLEALRGTPETTEGSVLNLLKVIDYVTRRVQGDAAQMGRTQTPTLRGQLDGAPVWPIFTPGPLSIALNPGIGRSPATPDPNSLAAFGISPHLLAPIASSIQTLNALQLAAINEHHVLDNESLVVTAPTSSGKTMIGELAALRRITDRQRAIFLLPMRALVNDKYDAFRRTHKDITVIRATGEHNDNIAEFLRGQFDIALLTYEKYAALALGNAHVLDLAATVIIDEAQTLTDRARGSNLEFIVTLLNNRRGRAGSPQLITLSAVVGDLRGLPEWLSARHLHTDVRPVPLVEGVLDHNGTLRTIDADGLESITQRFLQPLYASGSRATVIPLVQRLVAENKKVIVFRQTKGEAVACAVYLSQALGLPPCATTLSQIQGSDSSTSTRTLHTTLQRGVAFHTSDLNRDERVAVEHEFRDPTSSLQVVVATPTLAMGVNTPASAVVIVGLTHPGAVPTPYSVAEYKNMVGRAGRLGLAAHGESYLIPEGSLEPYRAWAYYVTGRLENLDSQLIADGDPRSLMLRVLATYPADHAGTITDDDILGFLDSSFAAFQARAGGNPQWTPERLQQGLAQLVAASLVHQDNTGYRLTPLGRFAGESGVHVESILRLVHALRGTPSLNSAGLLAATQLTVELDEVYIPINAKAKNTEVPRWPRVLQQQQVPYPLIAYLQHASTSQAVSRCKRAASAAMWIAGLPTEKIELELTQHLRQSGGVAGAIRSIAERTRDLLPAVAAVMTYLHPEVDLGNLVERTQLRLELGVPAEIVEVIQQTGTSLSRSQWVSLAQASRTTLESIVATTSKELQSILGDADNAERLQGAANGALRVRELPVPLPTE